MIVLLSKHTDWFMHENTCLLKKKNLSRFSYHQNVSKLEEVGAAILTCQKKISTFFWKSRRSFQGLSGFYDVLLQITSRKYSCTENAKQEHIDFSVWTWIFTISSSINGTISFSANLHSQCLLMLLTVTSLSTAIFTLGVNDQTLTVKIVTTAALYKAI